MWGTLCCTFGNRAGVYLFGIFWWVSFVSFPLLNNYFAYSLVSDGFRTQRGFLTVDEYLSIYVLFLSLLQLLFTKFFWREFHGWVAEVLSFVDLERCFGVWFFVGGIRLGLFILNSCCMLQSQDLRNNRVLPRRHLEMLEQMVVFGWRCPVWRSSFVVMLHLHNLWVIFEAKGYWSRLAFKVDEPDFKLNPNVDLPWGQSDGNIPCTDSSEDESWF